MSHATSNRFREALKDSHRMRSKVELRTPEGALITELVVQRAEISIDSTDTIRRRVRVQTPLLDDYIPLTQTGMFHPFSMNQIWCYRGVVYDDGTEELVELGRFHIAMVWISDAKENPTIDLNCYDFSRTIQRRRFLDNYIIPPGMNYGEAIQTMIASKYSPTKFDFSETDILTPQLVFGGSNDTGGGNAWDAGVKMAESIGYELFMNSHGVCVLRPVPTFDQEPVAHYHEGEDCNFLYLTRKIEDEDTYNYVQVRGESTSNEEPVVGWAADINPASPTFIGDPPGSSVYGVIPTFMTSRFVTSTSQAYALAQARLRQRSAAVETVQINMIADPSLETGDVISIKRKRSKVDDNFIVDKIPIGLTYEMPMVPTLRKRTA